MASLASGVLRIPVWNDDGEIKPVVDANGRIPVTLDAAGVTLDVNLESSDITLNINLLTSSITLDVNLKTSDITLGVTESSPLTAIQAQSYGWDLSNWRKNPISWGLTAVASGSDTTVKSGAGNATITVATVPTGYVYVINGIMSRNDTTAITQRHILGTGGVLFIIKEFITHTANIWAISEALNYVLTAGDTIQVTHVSCADGDTIISRFLGYSMKVTE